MLPAVVGITGMHYCAQLFSVEIGSQHTPHMPPHTWPGWPVTMTLLDLSLLCSCVVYCVQLFVEMASCELSA
jgi:hypothetical protein